MKSITIKLNKRTAASFFFSVMVLLGVGVLAIFYSETDTLPTGTATEVPGEAERVKFLESYGWTVDPATPEKLTITMPEVLDETLNTYNAIQAEQGMDLEKYCGKTLTRYTYKITNYPSGDKDVVANLYLSGVTIVAGDVSSTKLNGFLQGLTYPEVVNEQK